MKNLNNILDNWEKSLLFISIFASICSIIYFILRVLLVENPPAPTSGAIPQEYSLLQKNSTAFLDYSPKLDPQTTSPFYSYIILTKKDPSLNQTPAQQPPKPQPPPKPKIIKNVSLSGTMTTQSGETVAFISITDSSGKKSSFNVKQGESFDIFSLKTIDSEKILFTDNSGKTYSLSIHSMLKIELQ